MRVRYVDLPSGTTISVLALESGDGFALFTTKNGYQAELAAVGNCSAPELIEGQRKAEALLTWILRGVGMLLMFLGFAFSSRRFPRWRPSFRFSAALWAVRRPLCHWQSRCRSASW